MACAAHGGAYGVIQTLPALLQAWISLLTKHSILSDTDTCQET